MGLTKIRAQQISDIDYKQAVRVIATTDVTLSGGAPALVDGVSVLAGDRVLVNGQSTGSQNGLYRVQTVGTGNNGTWVRTTDANETGEIQAGMIVMVTEGDLYKDTQWKLTTNDPIVVGVTALTFVINVLSSVGGANTQIQYNNAGTLAGSANLVWTGTTLSIGGNIIPQANITYNLGNSTNRWNDIWLANSSIYLGNAVITANATSLIFTNPEGAEVAISGAASDITADTITATGNISGNYFLGNGSQLTGITTDATSIQNGTSNVRAALNGNVTTSVAGTANVLTVTSTGANITGTFTSTGNVLGEYILGNGAYLSGLNLSFGVDALSFTGDGSTVAFTILDGYSANTVMVFENGVAQAPGTDYTVSGNVVTFSQAPGSGVAVAMRLLNGSSTGGGGGGGNVDLSAVAQDILPSSNNTYNLGNTTNRWANVYLAGNALASSDFVISTGAGSGNTALTISAANQQATFVTPVSQPGAFGFRNRIINGNMVTDQRNSGAAQTITAAAALAYTVDRWYAYCTGANVTGQQVAGSDSSRYRYQFTGAASVTKIGFAQRIEAANSYDLNGTTATLSVDLANSVLTTVTWTAWYANTTDTFGTLASPTRTQIATGTFTVTSSVTRYSTQITIPSAATTGIEIELSVGAQTSGTWTIGDVQLERGAAATPFETVDITRQLMLCQRYYFKMYRGATGTDFGPGFIATTTAARVYVNFPVSLRTYPSAVETTGTAADYAVRNINSTTACSAVPAFFGATQTVGGLTLTVASGLTAGQGCALRTNATAAYVAWSVEL